MLERVLAMDAILLVRILALPHPDWLNAVFLSASRAGTGGAIWLAASIVLFLRHQIGRLDVIRLILAILCVHIIVDLGLKPWIDRPRPPLAIGEARVIGDLPETRSFPSGHAANASAAAVVLTAAWPHTGRRLLILAVATLVGVARVYLGTHYPLDAVAGAFIGLLIGWVVHRVQALHRPRSDRAGG